MTTLRITAGPYIFTAHMEEADAPATCAAFRKLLPYRQKLIHARWSGEACWIPLGALDLELGPESATSTPAPGQVLLYPGGVSETEILIAYGPARFASVHGVLAGNPVLSIENGLDRLAALGREVLWGGAREVLFETAPEG